MPVALRSLRPDRSISIRSVLASRTAGYAIRMSGGVGGGDREVTPYPYMFRFLYFRFRQFQVDINPEPVPNQVEITL